MGREEVNKEGETEMTIHERAFKAADENYGGSPVRFNNEYFRAFLNDVELLEKVAEAIWRQDGISEGWAWSGLSAGKWGSEVKTEYIKKAKAVLETIKKEVGIL